MSKITRNSLKKNLRISKKSTVIDRDGIGLTLTKREFDVKILPEDMQRVFKKFEKKHGREYALLVIFNMRTGIELHRAWHMSLLTSKIMQRVKDAFNLRMNWQLGVIRMRFLLDDGRFQLHRRVPYDYDSEYQDLFMRIAYALCKKELTVEEALIFQEEAKQGLHTAKSGIFLRDFPGRLILYPALSSTAAVIFFSGDWEDAGVAAVTGLATGISTMLIESMGSNFGILVDIVGGLLTGLIGALFFRFQGQTTCLKAVFLGTLYWFFYGTAFVIGLLEIVAGELETGVTRFMAVSIKTFALSTSAAAGMAFAMEHPAGMWEYQRENNCGRIDLDVHWWRIPLYLASSAAALGQYRFRIVEYWRGLLVQLVGYEVQYQVMKGLSNINPDNIDRIDTIISNIAGAAASVVTATIIAFIVNAVNAKYYGNMLESARDHDESVLDRMTRMIEWKVKFANCIRLGRKDEQRKLSLAKKLKRQQKELRDPQSVRASIDKLTPEEENLIIDTIVFHRRLNIWSMLMPAVYQLVPGSMIANLWFNMIFPPVDKYSIQSTNVFGDLMVTAMSLALGLIVGFFITSAMKFLLSLVVDSETPGTLVSNFGPCIDGMVAAPIDAKEDDPLIENEKILLEKMKSNPKLNVGNFEVDEKGEVFENEVE